MSSSSCCSVERVEFAAKRGLRLIFCELPPLLPPFLPPPPPLDMVSDFDWLVSKVQEKLDWTQRVEGNGTTQWLQWMNLRHFVWILKDRSGYLVMRPVYRAMIPYMAQRYFQTIYWYHVHGDTIWVDSGWAPGKWPDCLEAFKLTGRKYVGWHHEGWVYVCPISELSGDKPILSQLKRSSIRSLEV